MKGFTQLSLAVLVTFASAVSVNLNKRESPLSVFLSSTGNTEVMVAVTNHGDKTLNLLSKGTFLDEELPVEKVSVFSKGGSKFGSFLFLFLTSISLLPCQLWRAQKDGVALFDLRVSDRMSARLYWSPITIISSMTVDMQFFHYQRKKMHSNIS
jgi:hypothetical protein